MRTTIHLFALLAVTLAQPTPARADDAFYDIPLSKLKITAGELPKEDPNSARGFWQGRLEAMMPVAALDGPGEAYVHDVNLQLFPQVQVATTSVVIRAPEGQNVSGCLRMPKANWSGMQLVKFEVPATAAKKTAAEAFYRARLAHYQLLRDRDLPGTAWFRHMALQTRQKLAEHGVTLPDDSQQRLRGTGAANSYDLFSGGRAVSENLQLDRNLRNATAPAERDVDVSSLQGITVAEIDWKPLLKEAQPKLDPLARLIPADQHVVFFPSFQAVLKLADQSNIAETQLFELADPRSEDAGIRARYERQLGLSLGMGRLVGPAVIKSMALTGSDPYFASGTDVAVLFEAGRPEALAKLILTQIELNAGKEKDAARKTGKAGSLDYQGFATPDRRLSSYVATLDGAVVVTNSLAQLDRLAAVGGDVKSIATLDEFKFFRLRYPLGDKDETAFVFLSDAAIRRWCGPRWRIASARRTQAAAVLAELTAANLNDLAGGKSASKRLETDLTLMNGGELTLSDRGVLSSTYGTLEWMTPIVELPLAKVTKAEADAYNLWRNQYQQNWRWAFDPIALRLGAQEDKLAADLTVMPLIAGTEYREFISVSRGAKLAADDGDKHNSLGTLALAINTNSNLFRQAGTSLSTLAPQLRTDPFGWLGSAVSVYVDDDPLWQELRSMSPENRKKLINSPGRFPVGVCVGVANPLKLTAFLVAVRAFVDQTAPGMVTWENLTYRDQGYVRIKPTEQTRNAISNIDLAIYYAPAADGLTLTMNEGVVKRAIDRRLARREAEKNQKPAASGSAKAESATLPWLGANFCLQIERPMFDLLTGQFFDIFDMPGDNSFQALMQARAWGNLPILNEWKRFFPDQDPVAVHERLWHTRLVSPAGGSYVWNDEWKTMESTVFGHQGQPKVGPTAPPGLARFKSANFGLTFEDKGLRARMELMREKR